MSKITTITTKQQQQHRLVGKEGIRGRLESEALYKDLLESWQWSGHILPATVWSAGVPGEDKVPDVVWCGVVWCDVVWWGVVWWGVVWCGLVWCGVVWWGGVGCGVV